MDTFWKLPDHNTINSQDEFYAHLKKSDHLKNTIYKPDILDKKLSSQTTRISDKTFECVSFSRTTIKNIIFNNCTFRNCLLIGSRIVDCEFHNCHFILTNTHKINIHNTYIDPESFRKCLKKNTHQNIGVHLYQILLKNCRTSEQIEFERDAQFNFLRWKRYQDFFDLSKIRRNQGIFFYVVPFQNDHMYSPTIVGKNVWFRNTYSIFYCDNFLRSSSILSREFRMQT